MRRCLLWVFIGMGVILAARWAISWSARARAGSLAAENGDTNGDGDRDLSDAIYYLSWLYLGGPEPVAIAGSSGVEARVAALEDAVFSGDAALDAAVRAARELTPGAEDLWTAPAGALVDTAASGTPARVALSIGGVALGHVVALRLEEGLSVLPRLDVILEVLSSSYAPIAPASPLRLSYEDASGAALFHGEVGAASLAGSDGESVYVHVVGYTKLHRLTRGRKSRVFLDQRASDIVGRILEDAGVGALEFQMLLEEAHPVRSQVVQHNESDWDFVARLLEEEGIYSVVLHESARATIRFADSGAGLVPSAGVPVPYVGFRLEPPAGTPAHISLLRRTVSAGPERVTVGDYDLARVQPVFATAGDSGGGAEDFEYGVNLVQAGDLAVMARRRLDLLEGSFDVLEGASNATEARPGRVITVGGSEKRFNGKYLIVGATHRYFRDAGGGSYGNTFHALPDAVRYRPPRVTPKSGLAGVQSAVVTGPAGTTTHSDAYGRVKVRFHWDRSGATDDTSSAWVRVAQNRVAGALGAYLPEVGDEVLVAFEHGDIDRPVVLGSLWNGSDRPPR
jgi:type VI secretion system secreted protein VgrG